MYHDISILIAIVLYLSASGFLYFSFDQPTSAWRPLSVGCASTGAAFHLFAFWQHWSFTQPPDVNLLSLLSLCALVIVIMLCVSVLSRNGLFDAGMVSLPIAALVLLLEWAVPASPILLENNSAGTTTHIISSVLAFGFLAIAAVYAMFIALIDHFLRSHHLNRMVRSLPPLEILERLLFRLITAGFLLLSLSLISGLAFVSDLFAQHLVHKTTLSFIAWLIFGTLLFGRWRYGWRGRKAVRLCLAGTALLLLAYFGSKLVLENLLGRGWQM
jgi:ABC-type uncharacterized transport system permease subunit